MQKLLHRLYTLFENMPPRLLSVRWPILIGIALLTTVLATGIAKSFSFDVSNEAWLEEGAPELQVRKHLRQLFGSEDGVFIVYKAQSGDVFSEKALRTIAELHAELELAAQRPDEIGQQMSRVVKLDSLYNARYQVAEGDMLISKKLIGRDFPESAAERERRRRIALSQDGFRRLFFSDDFRYGGIQIKTDFGVVPLVQDQVVQFSDDTDLLAVDEFDVHIDDAIVSGTTSAEDPYDVEFSKLEANEYLHFMQALRKITAQAKYDNFEFFFAGNAVTNEFMIDSSVKLGALMALMALIVMGFLWRLFRSLSAVVWPMLIVALTGVCTVGLMCWMGFHFTGMLMVTMMLVLAISIASCVHVLSTYLLSSSAEQEFNETIAKTYRKTGFPILLTSFTTAVGMLSLSFAEIPSIRVFGYSSAIAVCFSFLFVCVLLPVLMHYWRPETTRSRQAVATPTESTMQNFLAMVSRLSGRHAKTIIAVYAVVIVVTITGFMNLHADANLSEMGRKGTAIDTANRLVDREMMGGMNMEILLTSETDNLFKNPDVLKQISALQEHVKREYGDKVVKIFSLADVVRESNQVMHQGRADFYTIPDDPLLTAQLLYLFNNANAEDRRNIVTDDYRSSHVSILMRNGGSREYTPFFDALRSDLDLFFSPLQDKYPDLKVSLTGTFPILIEVTDDILWTQLKSFSAALLVITITLMFTLGSFQAGLLAMVPNLLPAIFTFGVIGWLDIPLDVNILVIAPVIIGIAVDDTVHFLSHYRYVWMETGDVGVAVERAVCDVGQAVIYTSLILGLGFAVLGFSEHVGLVKPGLLGAVAILVALLSDLFFLPALMRVFKPGMGRREVPMANAIAG